MSRDLSLCCSKLQAAIPALIEHFEQSDPFADVRVISTERSTEEQQALYAQGRTTPGPEATPENPLGNVVTHADGLTTVSSHQAQVRHGERACHAVDLGVFVSELYQGDADEYLPLKELAAQYGLRSGWTFPQHQTDPDHLECPPDAE